MLHLFKKANCFKALKPLSLFSKYPKFFSQEGPQNPKNPENPEKSSQNLQKDEKAEKHEKVEKIDRPLLKPLTFYKSSKRKPFTSKDQKSPEEKPVLKVFAAFGPKTEYFNSAKEQKEQGDLDEYFSVPKSMNRAPFDRTERKNEPAESEAKTFSWQRKPVEKKFYEKKPEKKNMEKNAKKTEEKNEKKTEVLTEKKTEVFTEKETGVFTEKKTGVFTEEKHIEKNAEKNVEKKPFVKIPYKQTEDKRKSEESPKFSQEKNTVFKGFDFKQTSPQPQPRELDKNIEKTEGNIREINEIPEEKIRVSVPTKEKSYKRSSVFEQKPKMFKFTAEVPKKSEEDFYQESQPEAQQRKPTYAKDLGHMQFFKPGTFLTNISRKDAKKEERYEKIEKKDEKVVKKDEKIEKKEGKTGKTREKRPFSDKKELQTEKKPFEAVEILKELKEEIAAKEEKPNLSEIYEIYRLKEKTNEKEENLFMESLFSRSDFSEIQQNFARIIQENRLLWLSFTNVHTYFAKLIENEDLSGLISLYSHLKACKYNFSALEIALFNPFLHDISSSHFITKIQITLQYVSFLPLFPSNLVNFPQKYSIFFKKLSIRPLFRLILHQIQAENDENPVFLDLSFTILRTFIDLDFLNFKVIRPYDLAEWCILNIENPESLPFLIEILSKYESKTFPMIFAALYGDFLKKKGFAPYNNVILEENYLKLVEKFTENTTKIDANSFEFLLILADGLKNTTIILDLYTKLEILKKREDFDFFFVYDWMMKTIPSLPLEANDYTRVIKKVIDEERPFLVRKPRIHTIAMIKGLIKEKKYKESCELFFSDLYRKEVSEFEQKKVIIFLNSVILTDLKSVKNMRRVKTNLKKLVSSLNDDFLHRLFRNESNDMSILHHYLDHDIEAYGKKQQELEYFRLLFEESGFSMEKMKEKIENRDKSYDKHLHFKYHEFLGKFDENLKNFEEEENKKKLRREELREFFDDGQLFYEDSDLEEEEEEVETKVDENPDAKDEDIFGEKEKKVKKIEEYDDEKDDIFTEEQMKEILRLKKEFLKNPEKEGSDEGTEEEHIAILLGSIEMIFGEQLEDDPTLIKEHEENLKKLRENAKNDKNAKNKKKKEEEEEILLKKKVKKTRYDELKKGDLQKVIEKRMLFFNDIGRIVKVDCQLLKEEVFELILWGIENKEPCGNF